MSNHEKFAFVIPAYTPETMPLDRLIEYLRQIATIIGEPENLHLIAIGHSSTVPTFSVPYRTAVVARERAAQVGRGEGTKDQSRAYNRIRKMLRRDAPGAGRPARLVAPGRTILEIPAAADDSGVLTGVRQATSVDGALIRIGGAGETAALQMQDMQGRVMSGFSANKHLAKEMARRIDEPTRINRVGLWNRNTEGAWELDKMQDQSFETLEDEPLTVTLQGLRKLAVRWPDGACEKPAPEREASF